MNTLARWIFTSGDASQDQVHHSLPMQCSFISSCLCTHYWWLPAPRSVLSPRGGQSAAQSLESHQFHCVPSISCSQWVPANMSMNCSHTYTARMIMYTYVIYLLHSIPMCGNGLLSYLEFLGFTTRDWNKACVWEYTFHPMIQQKGQQVNTPCLCIHLLCTSFFGNLWCSISCLCSNAGNTVAYMAGCYS